MDFEDTQDLQIQFSSLTLERPKIERIYEEFVKLYQNYEYEEVVHFYYEQHQSYLNNTKFFKFDSEGNIIEISAQSGHFKNNHTFDLEGVMITASKFRGNPPTKSPYGDRRFDIPAKDVLEEKGGKKKSLFFLNAYENESGVKYIEFLLCNHTRKEYVGKFGFKEVNLNDNPFLYYDGEKLFCVKNLCNSVKTYVKVYHIDDINFKNAICPVEITCISKY